MKTFFKNFSAVSSSEIAMDMATEKLNTFLNNHPSVTSQKIAICSHSFRFGEGVNTVTKNYANIVATLTEN